MLTSSHSTLGYFDYLSQQTKQVETQTLLNQNQQKIKLYMSLSEQLIPDIVNEPLTSIYSHFKFYFNDDQLMIMKKDQSGNFISVMHEECFEEEIGKYFQEWAKSKVDDGNQGEGREKDRKFVGSSKQQFSNFIAFVQYWIRHSPRIYIEYRVYDELVSQCVANFLDNEMNIISYNLSHKKKVLKLLNEKFVKKQDESLSSSLIQKRLKIYFNYFSKMKNFPYSSCNSTYTNNINKTFDQIIKSYKTMNIQQWICFIKVFDFDKIFEQVHRNKVREQTGRDNKNCRQYLPVKYVQWNTSLHYFKNLFEKYCSNSKQLEFGKFVDMVKKLFQVLFGHEMGQNNTDKRKQNISKSPVKLPKKSPQHIGIFHLKLPNQQQFNNKLRSLGIFVPLQQTSIVQTPIKPYNKIKPRYLNKCEIPGFSQNRTDHAKNRNKLNENQKIAALPIIGQRKASQIYTIQALMKKNGGTLENNSKFSSCYGKQEQYQTPIYDKQNNYNSSNQQIDPTSTKYPQKSPKIQRTIPQKQSISFTPQLEPTQQQDQYLNQYYQKNRSNIYYNNPHLTSNIPDRIQTYNYNAYYDNGISETVNDRKKNNGGYYMGNGYGRSINILKKIDERIDKIHQKLL